MGASESPAVDGFDVLGAKSFDVPFAAAGGTVVNPAVAGGAYELFCDVDCLVRVRPSTGTAVAALPTVTQGSANDTRRVYAGIPCAIDVPTSTDGTVWQLSVISKSATAGTLTVSGPFRKSGNR